MPKAPPWKPGQSGNPEGNARRARTLHDVVALARRHTREAIRALTDIVHDPNQSATARVRAAEVLLSRGWGQAAQRVDMIQHLSDEELERAARLVLQRRQVAALNATRAPIAELPAHASEDAEFVDAVVTDAVDTTARAVEDTADDTDLHETVKN